MTGAVVPGAELREPYFMYRRGRRALTELLPRLPQAPLAEAPMERWQFDIAYERVRATGVPMRSVDEAWVLLLEYRSNYGTALQPLIDYLLAPAGFWGHSAEDSEYEGQLG